MDNNESILKKAEFLKRHQIGQDDKKATAFYNAIVNHFHFVNLKQKLAFIVVAHKEHTLPYFLDALTHLGIVAAIILKGSRCVKEVEESIRTIYSSYIPNNINKITLKNPSIVKKLLQDLLIKHPDYRLMIIDHGGYFAENFNVLLSKDFYPKLAGVIEHTLNGEQKYQAALSNRPVQLALPFPMFSVAKSQIKAYEDGPIAASIVNAMQGITFSGHGLSQDVPRCNIGVIGYGHIGKAVALKLRGIVQNLQQIRICDISPLARAEASNFFIHISDNKEELLQQSDIIISAASCRVLDRHAFLTMKPGASVVCITSSDDLFTQNALSEFEPILFNSAITSYQHKTTKKIIHIAGNGDSINFQIGSTSHPILHAVLSAVCVSVFECAIQKTPYSSSIQMLSSNDQLAIEKVYEEHFGRNIGETKTFGFRRLSCFFVGRKEKQDELKAIVQQEHIGIITQDIKGLGGIGKSTLAYKYAEQALNNGMYDYIICFNSTNEKILYEEFKLLADTLSISISNNMSPKELISQIYKKLRPYRRILIVFDDVSDYEKLQKAWIGHETVDFLPPESASQLVHCIITTRDSRSFARRTIKLDEGFKPEEAILYIKHFFPGAEDNHAKELAETLHYFPLALCQAVAYLKKNNCTISSYITLYRTQENSQRNFLSSETFVDDHYSKTVYTTWNISISMLTQECPLGIDILYALAYFSSAPISLELLSNFHSNWNVIVNALHELEKYSLIDIDRINNKIIVHDLVKTVSRLKQKEKLNDQIIPLRNAMKAIDLCRYYNSTPYTSHCLEIIKFHEEFLKHEACEEKIEILLNIGNNQHFNFLFSEKAAKTFELSKDICMREHIGKHMIAAYIGWANSSSGAGDPAKYMFALDELIGSSDLKVEYIENALRSYNILINFDEAKQDALNFLKKKILWMAILIPFGLIAPTATIIFTTLLFSIFLTLQYVQSRTILQTLLSPFLSQARIALAPALLNAVGAKQLSAVYYIYRRDLKSALLVAEKYKQQSKDNSFERIESICLMTEIKMLCGKVILEKEITLLQEAQHILDENKNMDHFWEDQLNFSLSVLYAVDEKFIDSHTIIFSLWRKMCAQYGGIESVRERIKNLTKQVQFFYQNRLPQANIFFSHTFRILGRLLSALKEIQDAKNCFQVALELDKNSIISYYEYACFLYRYDRRHDFIITQLKKVIKPPEDLPHLRVIPYHHALEEKAILPECIQSLAESENSSQEVTLPIHALAYAYLALVSYENGNYHESTFYFDRLKTLQASNDTCAFTLLVTAMKKNITLFSSTPENVKSSITQSTLTPI